MYKINNIILALRLELVIAYQVQRIIHRRLSQSSLCLSQSSHAVSVTVYSVSVRGRHRHVLRLEPVIAYQVSGDYSSASATV